MPRSAVLALALIWLTPTSLTPHPNGVSPWGFWAHKELHRIALNHLSRVMPASAMGFFEAHRAFIIEHAIDADDRRRIDPTEAPQHFIDLDRYGAYPFKALPMSYPDAVKTFGEDTVKNNGLVPWRIAAFTDSLTVAMRERNTERMLFYIANLGHYVADCNVPLHATENYDGQLTNQRGLHSRWESEYPERFMRGYEARPLADSLTNETVSLITDMNETAFMWAKESFLLSIEVLRKDAIATRGLTGDSLKKTITQRNGRTREVYSPYYFDRYKAELNGMVERRFEDSAIRIASAWYTAWVNAGKPPLSDLK